MSTPNLLQLHCWVVGENQTFTVEIGRERSIYDLKKAIQAETHPDFQDVAARKLTLYKATIVNDDSINTRLQTIDLTTLTMLLPSHTISQNFKDRPPRGSIVVVIVQPARECKWLHAPAALTKPSIMIPMLLLDVAVPCFVTSY